MLRSPQIDLPKTNSPKTDSPKADSLKTDSHSASFIPTSASADSIPPTPRFSPLQPIRCWLDSLSIQNVKTARWIAKLIPAQCPFERDVKLLGRTLAHIPPLCKLNPFYDQLVTLRFRALCYLADECGEDIRSYC